MSNQMDLKEVSEGQDHKAGTKYYLNINTSLRERITTLESEKESNNRESIML